MSIEDWGRANPEILRKAGIPHASVVGYRESVMPVAPPPAKVISSSNVPDRVPRTGIDMDIPENVKASPAAIVAHQWSYAVVPGRRSFNIYLTGFCKNCQTAFTSELNTTEYGSNWEPLNGTGDPCITKLNIPLFGCEYKDH